MKKSLYVVTVLMIVVSLLFSILFVKTVFLSGSEDVSETVKKEEPHPLVNEIKEEEIEETKEEVVEKEDPVYEADPEKGEVYKMLDFDRRLILNIGQQDEWLCSIFGLAYARAILDDSFDVDPYDYYDGDGADWRAAGFEDIALSDPLDVVLQRAMERIDMGQPVLLYTEGKYCHPVGNREAIRSAESHYVLLIGYRMNAKKDDLKPSDFYAVDPAGGHCCDVDSYIPWVILEDEGPALVSGEYALYAPSEEGGVKTCEAYADRCTWDSRFEEAVLPDYIENEDPQ